MILVDTSAWVEYDRATESAVDLRLDELLRVGALVSTAEPVIMEVLAGARDGAGEARLRRLMRSVALLQLDAAGDYESAARIYRLCRRAGITPRGLVDCLIAAIAMRSGADLLAHDMDFARMASVVALSLDPASPREP